MPYIPEFYSAKEVFKPPAQRVYHSNSECLAARTIPQHERRLGTSDYEPCPECEALTMRGR